MGIPYSREINKAFDELNRAYGQVTPLISAAYEVLETTKNISLLLAAIQIITVLLLGLILLALIGLLVTLHPDFERERDELVTPALRWVTGWVEAANFGLGWWGWLLLGLGFGVLVVWGLTTRSGRWVRMKVQESVREGQKRLEKKMEEKRKKEKKEKEEGEDKEDGK